MTCEACARWTQGTQIPFTDAVATYGRCKPKYGWLPFWAARWQRDMQTNTRADEGNDCGAFDSGRSG
jgi:hypothetical protein